MLLPETRRASFFPVSPPASQTPKRVFCQGPFRPENGRIPLFRFVSPEPAEQRAENSRHNCRHRQHHRPGGFFAVMAVIVDNHGCNGQSDGEGRQKKAEGQADYSQNPNPHSGGFFSLFRHISLIRAGRLGGIRRLRHPGPARLLLRFPGNKSPLRPISHPSGVPGNPTVWIFSSTLRGPGPKAEGVKKIPVPPPVPRTSGRSRSLGPKAAACSSLAAVKRFPLFLRAAAFLRLWGRCSAKTSAFLPPIWLFQTAAVAELMLFRQLSAATRTIFHPDPSINDAGFFRSIFPSKSDPNRLLKRKLQAFDPCPSAPGIRRLRKTEASPALREEGWPQGGLLSSRR